MSDIWSGIGVDITSSEGEWLYRVKGEVRGPVLQAAIVDKLKNGEIDVGTLVAREGGGDFHPIARVAAFSQHIEEAQRLRDKRSAKTRKRLIGIVALLLVAGLGAGGFFMFREYESRANARILAAKKRAAEERKRKAELLKSAPKMALVALVSLGTKEDVKIRQTKTRRSAARRRSGSAKSVSRTRERPAEEEFVQSCKLSQNDIFGTLRRHLGKLNVCVEDEKARDTTGRLPDTLALEFVVKPNGKVVDFLINDRHFRRGPMNNCMIKAFRTITFPVTNGSNCPVTIPIKIGG